MAWEVQINPKAQEIFDAPEEEQGKMVNQLANKIDTLKRQNEKLKARNKELEQFFKDILRIKLIREHINNKLEKQRYDDAELERIGDSWAKENKYMEEHNLGY